MPHDFEIPTDAVSLEFTAHRYFGTGDYDKAAACFAALHSQDPDNFDFLIAWANALSHASRKDEAAQVIEKAIVRMDAASSGAIQTLYQLAAANGPSHARRAIAERLCSIGSGDDQMMLAALAADPQYRVPEWRQRLSDAAKRILSKSDNKTETIDLLCQLAAGAEDYATMCAAAEILSRTSDEERHLLAWIQAASMLGPQVDPHPIVAMGIQRPPTPQLTKSLIEYACICQVMGSPDAALDVYRAVISDQEPRPGAFREAVRLTYTLEGAEGLHRLVRDLPVSYFDDDRAAPILLSVLWQLGRDEEVLDLTDRLSGRELTGEAHLAYSASILVVKDEERAVLLFKRAFAGEDIGPEVEFCLQDAVGRLLRAGRPPEAFLSRIGLSESHIRARVALARIILAAEQSDSLRDDLMTVFGGSWTAMIKSFVGHFRRVGAGQGNRDLVNRAAFATVMTHRVADQDEFRLAYGLLRAAAMSKEPPEDAVISLAWFNSRPRVHASRVWNRPELTVDANERLELWRRVAGQAPSDPFVRREFSDARRVATPAILFAGMPRSASVYIYVGLMNGLRKLGIGGVAGGAFPNFVLSQEGFQHMMNSRAMSHTHLSPLEVNLREIGQRYQLDRMLVHVRDPRQALLSWHDFLPGVIRNLDPTQAVHYRLPTDYLDWSSDRQLEWLVDNWLKVITDWIIGWAKAPELDYFKTTILFTTFEELVQDQTAFFRRILDFYGIDHDLFVEPRRERGVANYRQGHTDSWRSVLSASQKRKAAEVVPDWLLKKFGWPPH